MKIEEAINYAPDGDALIFLGSGASYGAKNFNLADFKTGERFNNIFFSDIAT